MIKFFIAFYLVFVLFPGVSFANSIDLSEKDVLKDYCQGVFSSRYHCQGYFLFPSGLKITSEKEVTITASEKIILHGSNIIGQEKIKINLETNGVPAGELSGINISSSSVYGNVKSYYNINIDNSNINGDVITDAGDINLIDSYVFGTTTSHAQVIAYNTNFCGDITAEGSSINLNLGANNFVKGNVRSLFNTNINGGHVLGSITSTGLSVTSSANIYSETNAVNAHSTVSFVDNPVVCGDVNANVSISGDFQQKCSMNAPSCSEQDFCKVNFLGFEQCGVDESPPIEEILAIVASPLSSLSLVCEADKTDFTVNTFISGQPNSLMFNAIMSDVNVFRPIGFVSKNDDTFLMQTNQQGELVFNLEVNSSVVDYDNDYSIQLSLVEDPRKVQQLKLKFAPQVFRIGDDGSPISLIAGKGERSRVVLMACSNDTGGGIASSYNGTPRLDVSLIHPKEGFKDIQVSIDKFEQGNASLDVLANESGTFEAVITDSFKCDGVLGCPQSGEVVVKGVVELKSRPWTLALCSIDLEILPHGDSIQGESFVKSGELFSLVSKPIVWSEGGELGVEFDTRFYCNNQVTRNFFLDSGNAGFIILSGTQVTPVETSFASKEKLESKGELRKSSYTLHENQCNEVLGYCFSQLFWNEVGSLRLYSVFDRPYLGQYLDKGFIELGRFYPSHFVLDNNIWHYPKGYEGFAYLGQPVPLSFWVTARNLNGNVVNNYAYFSKNLQARFSSIAFDSCASSDQGECVGELMSERVIYSLDSADWSASSGAFEANEIPYTLARKVVGTAQNGEIITQPDGDFSHGFGLTVIDNIDNIDFEFLDLKRKHVGVEGELLGSSFPNQPKFYYGRLNLSDVGGISNTTISVPSVVEYWDGSRFRVNEMDSGTILNVDKEKICKLNIWGDGDSGSYLATSGENNVFSRGRYSYLDAVPSSVIPNLREQVRFYSLLDHSIPRGVELCELPNEIVEQSWLKYNWSNNGDESPSTVVTYGVYRGNDRVIFRGEPNMYGKSN